MNVMSHGPGKGGNADEVWLETDPWIRIGKTVVAGFFIGLIIWSALVSISGAVVTGGTVRLQTSYQDIQSLEGGIIAEIPVKNGELVSKGQALLKLNDTLARTNMGALRSRVNDLLIKEARLIAERDNAETFSIPSSIQVGDREAGKAYSTQMGLFVSRRKIRISNHSMLSERIVQLEGELAGLKSQYSARSEQRKINEKELEVVMPLFERGYVSQQRLSPLKRESARLAGEIGKLKADIGKAHSAIAEARLRKKQIEKQFISEVVGELSQVQASLAEERQSLQQLQAVMSRTIIKAPRSGRVHALSVKNIGSVVRPGALLMQIIPDDEQLVVEAKIAPREVDRVHAGQISTIRFPSFDAGTTPRLMGKVAKVSPAEQEDPKGRTYFTARIEIPPDELAKIASGHRLVPGMPAEVFIETRSRTILSYLFKPLIDTMGRALRER